MPAVCKFLDPASFSRLAQMPAVGAHDHHNICRTFWFKSHNAGTSICLATDAEILATATVKESAVAEVITPLGLDKNTMQQQA